MAEIKRICGFVTIDNTYTDEYRPLISEFKS